MQCSSILGLVPYPWRGAYNASKHALEALSLTMAMELYGSGIHVSLLEPARSNRVSPRMRYPMSRPILISKGPFIVRNIRGSWPA